MWKPQPESDRIRPPAIGPRLRHLYHHGRHIPGFYSQSFQKMVNIKAGGNYRCGNLSEWWTNLYDMSTHVGRPDLHGK